MRIIFQHKKNKGDIIVFDIDNVDKETLDNVAYKILDDFLKHNKAKSKVQDYERSKGVLESL